MEILIQHVMNREVSDIEGSGSLNLELRDGSKLLKGEELKEDSVSSANKKSDSKDVKIEDSEDV